jgi:hypothetical protein
MAPIPKPFGPISIINPTLAAERDMHNHRHLGQ